jgi:hypothetical protein
MRFSAAFNRSPIAARRRALPVAPPDPLRAKDVPAPAPKPLPVPSCELPLDLDQRVRLVGEW